MFCKIAVKRFIIRSLNGQFLHDFDVAQTSTKLFNTMLHRVAVGVSKKIRIRLICLVKIVFLNISKILSDIPIYWKKLIIIRKVYEAAFLVLTNEFYWYSRNHYEISQYMLFWDEASRANTSWKYYIECQVD